MSTPFVEELFKKDKSKGFAIASMVLGIVSLVCTISCCCLGIIVYYLMEISAIVGVVLGIISLVKHKAGYGMAVAGIVMCSISIVLAIILAFLIVFDYRISSEQLRRFFERFNHV